jgi:hypothetical protein
MVADTRRAMNKVLFTLIAIGSICLPGKTLAQEPKAPVQPDSPNLRERLRDLPPEERQARIQEMREQFGGPNRPQGGLMAGRMAGSIERINAVLTPEQRESIRTIVMENREAAAALEQKLRDARQAMLESALDKNASEETLRQKLDTVAKLETELTLLRIKAFAKVEPPLSAEQIERIKTAPMPGPMMRERNPGSPSGPPEDRLFRERARSGQRPPDGPPRDQNDLPPPAQP